MAGLEFDGLHPSLQVRRLYFAQVDHLLHQAGLAFDRLHLPLQVHAPHVLHLPLQAHVLHLPHRHAGVGVGVEDVGVELLRLRQLHQEL